MDAWFVLQRVGNFGKALADFQKYIHLGNIDIAVLVKPVGPSSLGASYALHF
jgi:hypothetical protein